MDSVLICILCIGLARADFASFGTTWNWNGEFNLNWYPDKQDIMFLESDSHPFAETIANTFTGAESPWVIEDRTCTDNDICTKQVRITQNGELLLGYGNQTLEASILFSGRNAKATNVPLTPFIKDTRYIFRIIVVAPRRANLPDLQGMFGPESWMERAVYEIDNPSTQPMATAQILIPNTYLLEGTIIRLLGFTRPYNIIHFAQTKAFVKGSEGQPKRGASFNLRLVSRPSKYQSANPLETLWLQIQFDGQGDATARNVFKAKMETTFPPHNLGYAVASPVIYKFGSYFDSAIDVVQLSDTPVAGAIAFSIQILDASLLANQYILVDFLLNGLSEDDDDLVFSAYICMNSTFGGRTLCSAEPLVSFERLGLTYMRHISNQLLIPNLYIDNGAIIHIYGDVYADHAENVMKSYEKFVAGFTISVRTEFYVYPGDG
jgi:hypothetical protein